MIFLGLCSNVTAENEFILDAIKLIDMKPQGNSPIAYQCEIGIPILYPEPDNETRDATLEWMTNLFEKVSEQIVQQAMVISPYFDLGGYDDYTNQSLQGIQSIAPLLLRGKEAFAPYLLADNTAKPAAGDNLVIVKMAFAIQRHLDAVDAQPERSLFLVNFVAFEHWRRHKADVNKLQFVDLIKGSWEI